MFLPLSKTSTYTGRVWSMPLSSRRCWCWTVLHSWWNHSWIWKTLCQDQDTQHQDQYCINLSSTMSGIQNQSSKNYNRWEQNTFLSFDKRPNCFCKNKQHSYTLNIKLRPRVCTDLQQLWNTHTQRSPVLWSWTCSELRPSIMNGRQHLFHILALRSWVLVTMVTNHPVGDRGTRLWTNCIRLLYGSSWSQF